MKTINELRNELANYRNMKKKLEELLKNKNLLNRRLISFRIRRLDYKIWKTQRKLKEYAY